MSTHNTQRLTGGFSYTVRLSLLLLLLLIPLELVRADEIAVWNFNDANLTVDHGSGSLSTNFNLTNVLFAGGTSTNARLGDTPGQALSLQGGTGNSNNGRHFTINAGTEGFSGISVSFATQGSGTGFNNNQFQYSLDGVTFFDFGAPYAPAAAFGATAIIFDLSGISGLNNNAHAAFRLVFNGAASATGTNRIDNLVIDGVRTATTVPEPTAVLLLGSGLTMMAGAIRRGRRKR